MSIATLKQNIEAMHRTQQLPSFVQVLFTFKLALKEVEQLQSEKARLQALLRELVDIEGPLPGTADWAIKVRVALGDRLFYECPDCGRDIANSTHTADCPRK